MTESASPAPVVILDRPQLAENVGSAARAMANFGLSELRLVAPQGGWPQARAWALASGADWVLDQAQVYETVAEALTGLHMVQALTARPRETALPVIGPREASAAQLAALNRGERIGMLFGGERAGLETADIALTHAVVTLPVDAKHRSLNLAHAVAIMSYEWGVVRPEGPQVRTFKPDPEPAPAETMAGFFTHLERELDAGGFFFPPENKPSMMRNLRVAFGRARLTDQEVRTMHGVVTALVQGRGRTLAKLAGRGGEPE